MNEFHYKIKIPHQINFIHFSRNLRMFIIDAVLQLSNQFQIMNNLNLKCKQQLNTVKYVPFYFYIEILFFSRPNGQSDNFYQSFPYHQTLVNQSINDLSYSEAQHLNQANNTKENSTKYFRYHLIRYSWNPAQQCFQKIL